MYALLTRNNCQIRNVTKILGRISVWEIKNANSKEYFTEWDLKKKF